MKKVIIEPHHHVIQKQVWKFLLLLLTVIIYTMGNSSNKVKAKEKVLAYRLVLPVATIHKTLQA